MTTITELWANRANLRETKTVTHPAPELGPGGSSDEDREIWPDRQ